MAVTVITTTCRSWYNQLKRCARGHCCPATSRLSGLKASAGSSSGTKQATDLWSSPHPFLLFYSAGIKTQKEIMCPNFMRLNKWQIRPLLYLHAGDGSCSSYQVKGKNKSMRTATAEDLVHHLVKNIRNAPTLITSIQFHPLGNSPLLSESRKHQLDTERTVWS